MIKKVNLLRGYNGLNYLYQTGLQNALKQKVTEARRKRKIHNIVRNKNQHPFIKTLDKLENNILNLIKTIYKESIDYIIFSVKNTMLSS